MPRILSDKTSNGPAHSEDFRKVVALRHKKKDTHKAPIRHDGQLIERLRLSKRRENGAAKRAHGKAHLMNTPAPGRRIYVLLCEESGNEDFSCSGRDGNGNQKCVTRIK